MKTLKKKLQAKLAAASYGSGTGVPITVDYDYSSRTFTFKPTSDASATISIVGGTVGSPVANGLFGLGITPTAVNVSNGTYGASNGGLNTAVVPNGDLIRPAAQQRYGITVSYDGAKETFSISSGTTGDASEIEIDFKVGGATQSEFAKLMGFDATYANDSTFTVNEESEAVRGISSLPAITRGSSIAVNVNNNFSVDASNNTFVVSVDDVKGTLTLPISSGYTLDSFISALEKSINQLASDAGSNVSGVSVEYDAATNGLVFTTVLRYRFIY